MLSSKRADASLTRLCRKIKFPSSGREKNVFIRVNVSTKTVLYLYEAGYKTQVPKINSSDERNTEKNDSDG